MLDNSVNLTLSDSTSTNKTPSLELAEIRILLAIDDISDKYLVPEIIS